VWDIGRRDSRNHLHTLNGTSTAGTTRKEGKNIDRKGEKAIRGGKGKTEKGDRKKGTKYLFLGL